MASGRLTRRKQKKPRKQKKSRRRSQRGGALSEEMIEKVLSKRTEEVMLENKVINNMPENSNSNAEREVMSKFSKIYNAKAHAADEAAIKDKSEENAQKYLNDDLTWEGLVGSE
jgi:hypothetical protein